MKKQPIYNSEKNVKKDFFTGMSIISDAANRSCHQNNNKKSFMKTVIRKSGIFAIAFVIANLFFAGSVIGQTNYYYKGSGNINSTTNWGLNTDGSGTAPGNFTTANRIFNIRNTAAVTLNAAWTVSGASSKVIVGDGTNACNFTIPTTAALTGTIDVSAAATLTIANTAIPTLGTLDAASTVVYNGTSAQNITAVTYGTLTYSGSSTATFAGGFNIAGNFSCTSGNVTFNNTTTDRTFAITGSFSISSTGTIEFGSNTGHSVFNLTGNFSKTNGILTTTGNTENGLFNMVGSTQTMQSSGGTITKWTDFTIASGSSCTLVGTDFNMNASAGTNSTFTVSNGGTLNTGAFNILGTLTNFILSSGAALGIGSANGITVAGTASGNIQTVGRTYSTGANYIYNGSVAQSTGTGLPTALSGSLTINNTSGVTLSNAEALANGAVINIQAGAFAAGTNLTMATTTTINRSGGSMTGAPQGAGTYNINYTGNSMTTTTELAGTGLNNVTINLNSGQALTLDQNRTIKGILTLTQGNFITTSSATPTLTRTTTDAITGSSATSYINGPLKWTLPASLASGSTYNFPVGNTSYIPFSLVNPTTGTGAVTATVQAVTGTSGGTSNVDATLNNKSNTEYWSLATSGNFTNSSISAGNPAGLSYNAIGASTTQTGTYTSLAGTISGTSIINSNSIGSNRFFVLATAPSVITVSALSPTSATTTYGTASTNMTFTVSGTGISGGILVTPPSSAFEVSSTPGGASGFGATATVSGSGTIASTTIYVRLAAAANAGSYSGNINVTSSGATTKTVAISSSTVNQKALTATSTVTKVYDATINPGMVTLGTVTGLVGSETLTITPTAGNYTNANAGTGKAVTISYTLANGTGLASNYSMANLSGNVGTITARALTITAATNTKNYDGTTSAAAIPTITSGTLQGSDVANFTEVNSTKNAGTGKTLTPSGTVTDGNGGANYTYTFVNNTTGVINTIALTVTAVTNTKTYNGTTSVSATPTITSGSVQTGDAANFIETYDTKNAGTGKTLTPSGTVNDGNSGNNYTYTFVTNTTGVINALAITVTAATNTKTYDGTTSAAATPTVSPAVQSGDVANFTETYDTKNAGTGKTLTPSGTVTDGNSGNNYTYTFVNNTTGVINTRALTITGATNTKTYDGTTSASATPTITSGALQGSDVANFTEVYSNKNAGTGKTLTPSGTVTDGNGGANYTYTFVNNITGVINARALTVTGAPNTKTYDGTTSASATPTITSGALQGSDVANFTEVYSNKNAGTGKTLTPSGTVTDGNSGNNYTYTFVTNTTGIINALAITVTAAANTKTYNGTTSAAAIPTVSPAVQSGDVANFTETYDTRNVGTGKTLTPSGTVTDGNNGNNYTYTFVTNTAGVINALAITVTAVTNTKSYNGTTSASAIPTVSPAVQSGDVANFIETYDTKNVGTGKTLTPSGTVTDGNGGANYTYTFVNNTTGVINTVTLTYIANPASRLYGAPNPVFSGTISGFISGETQATATTGTLTFTSAAAVTSNIGSYLITGSGLTANNGNYTFVQAAGNATALTITPAPLSITANNQTKCSGIAFTFSGTEFTTSGLLNSDDVTSVTLTSAGAAVGATAGSYNIVPNAAVGSGLTNYTITYNNGTFTVNQSQVVNVGPALSSICNGSTSDPLGGSFSPSATSATWDDGGVGGTFNPSATTLNATWTPPATYTGTATLTLTTSGGSLCGPVSASKTQVVDNSCQVITLTQPVQLTATISGGGATICSGQSTTITVAISGGTAPYTINGVVQSGSSPFTFSVSPASTTTYTSSNITVSDGNSCTSSTTGSAVITVNQPSVAPTSLNGGTICNGANTFITQGGGSLGTGAYWQWYTDAGYTIPVGSQLSSSDASLSVSPSITTTYYLRVEGTASPCTGTLTGPSGGVTITVNQQSAAPTSATASATTICNDGSSTILTLNGGGGGTGEVIAWYSGSCGGTLVGTGNNLTVSPTTTTTYYGRYEDGVPCNFNTTCASVTITVNQQSAAPTSATASATTICNDGSSTILTLNGGGGGTGETIAWYTGSCGGTLVGTGNNITVSPTTTTTYYGRYEAGAPCNFNTACASVTITVNQQSAAPTSATASATTICNDGSSSTILTLNGGGGGTGEVIAWYSGSCGGTLVGTGNNLTVSPTTTTTYYGRYEDGVPCNFNTACASVTITVNQQSAAPTSATASATTICNYGSSSTVITLNGGGGGTNEIITWYTGSCGGTLVGTGNNLTVSPTMTTIYYGRYEDGGICNYNTACASIAITVNDQSSDPASATASATTICNDGSSTILTLNGGGGGTGEVIHWYSGSCGGTAVGTGNNLSVSPTTTTTYYGRYEDGAPCNFNTACASVTITVNQQSAAPTSATASATTICNDGSSTILTLNGGGGGTGEVIHWYSGSCGGTAVGTGNNLSVSPTTTTTYYGRYEDGVPCNFNTACASVTITVNQQSAAPTSATASATTICNGGSTILTLNGGGGGTGEVIAWYTGSCGGTLVGTDNNLTVSPTTTTTYYGRYEDGASCNFNTICASVTITVTAQPSATISYNGGLPYCPGTGSGVVTQSGTTGGTYSATPVGLDIDPSTGNINLATSFAGTYTVQYQVAASGGCSIYTTTTSVTIGPDTWTGNADANWNNVNNWSCYFVPSVTTDVDIPSPSNLPSGTYPSVFQTIPAIPVAMAHNVTIESGASLTVTTNTLQISGTISNAGSFNATVGTLEFNGTASQTIPANTFTGNNTIRNLIISNDVGLGGNLNITGVLSFGSNNKTLTTGGNLTLKSGPSLTAAVDVLSNGNSISGDVTVERYIATGTGPDPNDHPKTWQLLGVPTIGQTLKASWMEGASISNVPANGGDNTPGSQGNPHAGYGTMVTSDDLSALTDGFDAYTRPGPTVKVYNYLSGSYSGLPTAGTQLYDKRGYFVFARGDRSVYAYNQTADHTILRTKGTLFTPANPPVSSTIHSGYFESIGNPYAAPIDMTKITATGGGVSNYFYVWDPRLGGNYNYGAFVTFQFNGTNYELQAPGVSPTYGVAGTVNNYVQSGQAFFMQATGGDGTVSFDESAKAASATFTTPFTRQGNGQISGLPGIGSRPSSGQSQATLRTSLYAVNADGTTGALVDGVLDQFSDNYADSVDAFDARKAANSGENLSIKTGGKLLVIEKRHTIVANDTIFLNMTGERAQGYQFSLDAANLNTIATGYVEDVYTNTSTPLNLKGNTIVNFYSSKCCRLLRSRSFQDRLQPA